MRKILIDSDALQRECALDNGIDIFVTRNVRHYPKTGDVEILSPADFLRFHAAETTLG